MTSDPFGERLLDAVEQPVDTAGALTRVLTRYRRRQRLLAGLASAVVVLAGTAALRWTVVSDDGTPLRTVDQPSTTTTQPGSSVLDCAASTEVPLYAGQYSLAGTPEGYYSAGSVTHSSGRTDLGGTSLTELRLRSSEGREIDLASIGAERPALVIAEGETDSTTSTATVSPCVRLVGGPERLPIEATVFSAADHVAIGWQVWEYGAFKLTGRNGVTVAELVDVANSLVESPPAPPGGVRHAVPTHCGVLSTFFEGRLWIAVPARPSGLGDPLDGWDENDTPGWFVVSGNEAEFIADSGASAQFRRAQPEEADPQAGCE